MMITSVINVHAPPPLLPGCSTLWKEERGLRQVTRQWRLQFSQYSVQIPYRYYLGYMFPPYHLEGKPGNPEHAAVHNCLLKQKDKVSSSSRSLNARQINTS